MKNIGRYGFWLGIAGNAAASALCTVFVAAVACVLVPSIGHASDQAAAPGAKSAKREAGNAENGKRLFSKYGCYECHGLQGQGSKRTGPRIGPDPIPFEALVSYVRKPTGEMPPYTDKVVSDKELADIYAFLQSLPQPRDAKTIPLLHGTLGSADR